MTWLTILTWVKTYWKQLAGVAVVVLVLLTGKLWADLNTAQGQLAQCQAEKAAAEKKVEVSATTMAQLEARVKAKMRGGVDLVIDPGQPVRPGECPPCPKITLKADCGGETDSGTAAATKTTATASVTEKPGPGVVCPTVPAWALAIGGGVSLPGATIYHGSMAVDYHSLRAYGTLDTAGVWTAGAQAKVLTWNWP